MADKEAKKYYRTNIAGLKVVVGEPQGNNVAPEMVAFDQFEEIFQGDHVRVGYLATSDKRAIAKLKNDINVTEIEEDEYEQYTNQEVNPRVKKITPTQVD